MSDPSAPSAPPPLVPPRAALRAEARRMVRDAGHRRLVGPRCRVGRPGGASVPLPDPSSAGDPGLRADLVERALDGLVDLAPADAAPVLAWVTRSGELEPTDDDLAWLRAALTGFARHGVELPAFLVIGRHGCLELLTGAVERWSRVRTSRTAAGRPPPAAGWAGLGDGPLDGP